MERSDRMPRLMLKFSKVTTLFCFITFSLKRAHSRKWSALTTSVFLNSRGGRLRELFRKAVAYESFDCILQNHVVWGARQKIWWKELNSRNANLTFWYLSIQNQFRRLYAKNIFYSFCLEKNSNRSTFRIFSRHLKLVVLKMRETASLTKQWIIKNKLNFDWLMTKHTKTEARQNSTHLNSNF